MPNTKTKKFDWQIFLAVFCILLVICCATVCCVIADIDNGVARAEDAPSTNLTNLTFKTSDNFYIKNLSGATTEEIESYIKYFTNGIEGVLSDSVDFSYKLQVGTYVLTYNTSDIIIGDLYFELNQISSHGIFSLSCFLQSGTDSSSTGMFDILYMYSSAPKVLEFYTMQSTSITNSRFIYNVSTLNYLDWFSVFGISDVLSVNSIKFDFNYTTNLGCIISPNDTYATVPSFGGYDEGYQQGYDEGYDEGILDNITAYNQGYNDGLLVGSQFYKVMTYKEELYRLNQTTPYETYNRHILDLTTFLTDAFDINQRWYWCTAYNTTSIGGGVLYYPSGIKQQFDNIGDVLNFYKENGNSPIYCIYDAGASALHKFSDFVYIIDGYDFSIMLNDGYALGYQQGLNAGNKATEEELKSYEQRGFENGKLQGLQIGRQEGYNQGVLDANDYSFFSLFTSVFDAPITAIVGKWGDSDGDGVYQREGGMLNFYIPGLDINFAPFLLSLFTIGIIVLIIRFILARKS